MCQRTSLLLLPLLILFSLAKAFTHMGFFMAGGGGGGGGGGVGRSIGVESMEGLD